jgi:hypothetical protein
MESLEGHQMELQSMVAVEFFRDKVLTWQVTLGNVEEVLKVRSSTMSGINRAKGQPNQTRKRQEE